MKPPIFIIGFPSSGTTLVQSVINAHPSISCGPETGFLCDFKALVEDKYWEKVQKYGFTQEEWYEYIANFFESFKVDFASRQGKQRWADKTPAYTESLDFILKLFPECQIVNIVRNPKDVIASHKARWGYKTAVSSAMNWSKKVEKSRNIGRALPDTQYFEVRYEDLVSAPEEHFQSLFDFLNEPFEDKILEFDKARNFSNKSNYARYTSERREASGDSSLIYQSSVGKGDSLDPVLDTVCNLFNKELSLELGYR